MKNLKEPWVVRISAGAVLGLIATALIYQPLFEGGFSSPPGCQIMIEALGLPGAVAAAGVLFALLGGTAALATLPFADDGRALMLHSAAHFAVTVAEVSAILYLCFGLCQGPAFVLWIGMLALFYAVIWLGRWVGWYVEVMQLRTMLGLAPGPSPLKWQETAPYLPFILLLCDVLPLVLNWIDHVAVADVPVLSGLLLPYLILPAAGFCAGLSLGKRQGVCILYPAACFVCYLPMVYLVYNYTALFHCFMVAVPALAGNILGWAYRRAVPKKGRGAA